MGGHREVFNDGQVAALTSRRWLESGDRPQIGAIAADDSCGVTLNDRRFPTC